MPKDTQALLINFTYTEVLRLLIYYARPLNTDEKKKSAKLSISYIGIVKLFIITRISRIYSAHDDNIVMALQSKYMI
jgi:hypothetical protein